MKTLVEVRHAIIHYFQQSNVLRLIPDLDMVKFDCDDTALKIALVKEAMTDLEKLDMVRKISIKPVLDSSCPADEGYVLTKPLGMWDQNVTLGYRTALSIADTINDYCSQANIVDENCDASSIKERDLQKLILIIDRFSPKKEEKPA